MAFTFVAGPTPPPTVIQQQPVTQTKGSVGGKRALEEYDMLTEKDLKGVATMYNSYCRQYLYSRASLEEVQQTKRIKLDQEEEKLEQQHGGPEALAKWRTDEAAKRTKAVADKAASEQAKAEAAKNQRQVQFVTDRMLELRKSLAHPDAELHSMPQSSELTCNKKEACADWLLGPKEIKLLPSTKAGGRLVYKLTDVHHACLQKHGHGVLINLQAKMWPPTAEQSRNKLANLEARYPSLIHVANTKLEAEASRAMSDFQIATAAIQRVAAVFPKDNGAVNVA